jgi:hypothetical protein
MRKAAILVSGLALALTLGGCGDKADSGNAGADTGTVALRSIGDLSKAVNEQAQSKNSVHVVMSGEGAGEKLDGHGDMRFGTDDVAMKLTMTTSEGQIEAVLLDAVFYVKVPQEVEPGKSWVKIDTRDDSPLAKALAAAFKQAQDNGDPRKALEQFEAAGGEITATKEEELNGKKTVHYSLKIDIKKMAENQQDPDLKKLFEEAAKQGTTTFPVELWLDQENLPVRMVIDMPTADASGKVASSKMQIDFSDWGKPVEIAAPPADQVTELPG